jgi:p-aminobenzoyl-glutamate transporter AbgT
MKKIKAVALTIIIGYFATAFGVALMNWPQLGPIAAIATMGVFILNAIEHKKDE